MGELRGRAPTVRRFLTALVYAGTCTVLLANGAGQWTTTHLAHLPVAPRGWPVLGWLVGGPPVVMAALAWNERGRYTAGQRRLRATAYGLWIGLGGFALPALVHDSGKLYGAGVETGNPLAFGWTCGMVANIAAVLFALAIGRISAQGDAHSRELAGRFVEVAWILLVAVAMLFAAYGRDMGFTY